jgi:hypothetical protein
VKVQFTSLVYDLGYVGWLTTSAKTTLKTFLGGESDGLILGESKNPIFKLRELNRTYTVVEGDPFLKSVDMRLAQHGSPTSIESKMALDTIIQRGALSL